MSTNTPPIYGFLDAPAPGATIPQNGAILAGWALNVQRGGQQPFALRVRRTVGSGLEDVAVTARINAIERPDVQAAYGGAAAGMSRYTGYQITLGGLPPGPQTLTVEWADAYGAHYDQVSVVVA